MTDAVTLGAYDEVLSIYDSVGLRAPQRSYSRPMKRPAESARSR